MTIVLETIHQRFSSHGHSVGSLLFYFLSLAHVVSLLCWEAHNDNCRGTTGALLWLKLSMEFSSRTGEVIRVLLNHRVSDLKNKPTHACNVRRATETLLFVSLVNSKMTASTGHYPIWAITKTLTNTVGKWRGTLLYIYPHKAVKSKTCGVSGACNKRTTNMTSSANPRHCQDSEGEGCICHALRPDGDCPAGEEWRVCDGCRKPEQNVFPQHQALQQQLWWPLDSWKACCWFSTLTSHPQKTQKGRSARWSTLWNTWTVLLLKCNREVYAALSWLPSQFECPWNTKLSWCLANYIKSTLKTFCSNIVHTKWLIVQQQQQNKK